MTAIAISSHCDSFTAVNRRRAYASKSYLSAMEYIVDEVESRVRQFVTLLNQAQVHGPATVEAAMAASGLRGAAFQNLMARIGAHRAPPAITRLFSEDRAALERGRKLVIRINGKLPAPCYDKGTTH
jgi:hypothetical protein